MRNENIFKKNQECPKNIIKTQDLLSNLLTQIAKQ